MELNNFKSEDYIYLKVNQDFTCFQDIEFKKDTILRYKKENLQDSLWSRLIHQGFYDNLEFIPNPDCKEDEILPHQVFSKIYFKKNISNKICLWSKEKYCLNNWLMNILLRDGSSIFVSSKKKFNLSMLQVGTKKTLQDKDNQFPMMEIKDDNVELYLTFYKGEELDFTDLAVMLLFLDKDYIKLLSNCVAISGEEKERLFIEDFQDAFIDEDICMRSEYHYFKLNDNINVSNKEKLSFLEIAGIDIYDIKTTNCPYDYDKYGNLRYIFTKTSAWNSSNRILEQQILKYATRVPIEEAREHFERNKKFEEQKHQEYMKELARKTAIENKKIADAYAKEKHNSSIFPGTDGNFQHTMPYNFEEKKSTLEEIKDFYKRLKEINTTVINQMYFYGGTLPYILTKANQSRKFGDVDIFVPIAHMQNLRQELERQPSFEIIFDSKPLASDYSLTSKIKKNELTAKKNDLEFLSLVAETINQQDNNIIIDETGKNPLESYFERTSAYTHPIQDFGFKGKLFGVNISIFPIYQYGPDLMAKSFNVTDLYQYLLAVRVMNNTQLNQFSQIVDINNLKLNILPLEYTIISKQSAIEDGYLKRSQKDQLDLTYILEHKKELEINEERLSRIKRNYPDYSISIAYCLVGNKVETMGGEHYKKLMLQNKGRYLS